MAPAASPRIPQTGADDPPTLRAEPLLSARKRVAFVDVAALYDLAINSEDRVAEAKLETAERVVVAHTGRRVDFDGGAAGDRPEDTKARLAGRA